MELGWDNLGAYCLLPFRLSARLVTSMAYDLATSQMILFGGIDSSGFLRYMELGWHNLDAIISLTLSSLRAFNPPWPMIPLPVSCSFLEEEPSVLGILTIPGIGVCSVQHRLIGRIWTPADFTYLPGLHATMAFDPKHRSYDSFWRR